MITAVLAGHGLSSLKKFPKSQLIQAVIILIALFELLSFHREYNVLAPADQWLKEPDSIAVMSDYSKSYRMATLGTQVPWNRVFLDTGWKTLDEYSYLYNALMPNVNTLYDIRALGVYNILPVSRHAIIWDTMVSLSLIQEKDDKVYNAMNKLARLMSVQYIIAPEGEVSADNQVILPAPKGITERSLPPLVVSKYDDVPQRIRTAQYYDVVKTDREFFQLISLDDFDPTKGVILEGMLKEPLGKDEAQVDIVTDKHSEIEVTVESVGGSILVVGDTFYNGWTATIDGQDTEILPANINQRAVYIPEGRHTMKMVFMPRSFVIGAYISGIAHAIVLLVGSHLLWRGYRASLSIKH